MSFDNVTAPIWASKRSRLAIRLEVEQWKQFRSRYVSEAWNLDRRKPGRPKDKHCCAEQLIFVAKSDYSLVLSSDFCERVQNYLKLTRIQALGVQFVANENFVDLEYADDIAPSVKTKAKRNPRFCRVEFEAGGNSRLRQSDEPFEGRNRLRAFGYFCTRTSKTSSVTFGIWNSHLGPHIAHPFSQSLSEVDELRTRLHAGDICSPVNGTFTNQLPSSPNKETVNRSAVIFFTVIAYIAYYDWSTDPSWTLSTSDKVPRLRNADAITRVDAEFQNGVTDGAVIRLLIVHQAAILVGPWTMPVPSGCRLTKVRNGSNNLIIPGSTNMYSWLATFEKNEATVSQWRSHGKLLKVGRHHQLQNGRRYRTHFSDGSHYMLTTHPFLKAMVESIAKHVCVDSDVVSKVVGCANWPQMVLIKRQELCQCFREIAIPARCGKIHNSMAEFDEARKASKRQQRRV
ncbi:hypothetical protein CLF_102344 [Clonorchis sinensis]|uniref:Uncharacterized protein n=1 Tax=Clonorchis sinensis TaxID=79923 RepID=G7Y7Q2_CLOSI|nr:hypothetical protein CLF_102344 [Clonorchis sinensis]